MTLTKVQIRQCIAIIHDLAAELDLRSAKAGMQHPRQLLERAALVLDDLRAVLAVKPTGRPPNPTEAP